MKGKICGVVLGVLTAVATHSQQPRWYFYQSFQGTFKRYLVEYNGCDYWDWGYWTYQSFSLNFIVKNFGFNFPLFYWEHWKWFNSGWSEFTSKSLFLRKLSLNVYSTDEMLREPFDNFFILTGYMDIDLKEDRYWKGIRINYFPKKEIKLATNFKFLRADTYNFNFQTYLLKPFYKIEAMFSLNELGKSIGINLRIGKNLHTFILSELYYVFSGDKRNEYFIELGGTIAEYYKKYNMGIYGCLYKYPFKIEGKCGIEKYLEKNWDEFQYFSYYVQVSVSGYWGKVLDRKVRKLKEYVEQIYIYPTLVDEDGDGKLEADESCYIEAKLINKLDKLIRNLKVEVEVISPDYKDLVKFPSVKINRIEGWGKKKLKIPIRYSPFIHTGTLEINIRCYKGKVKLGEKRMLIYVMGASDIFKR